MYVFSVNKKFDICLLRYPNIRIPKSCIRCNPSKAVQAQTLCFVSSKFTKYRLLHEFQALHCLQKPLECCIIPEAAQGDYATFLRFLKQHRAWNSGNNWFILWLLSQHPFRIKLDIYLAIAWFDHASNIKLNVAQVVSGLVISFRAAMICRYSDTYRDMKVL